MVLYLRWSVHEVLERREGAKQPLRDQLKVAVAHIVHEVNICDVAKNCQKRGGSIEDGGQDWDGEKKVVHYVFCKWMDHSCHQSTQKLGYCQVCIYFLKQQLCL